MSNNPVKTVGILFVISSPSGGGKSTIIERLLRNNRNLRFSISATTRPRRKGEIEGKDYFFVDNDEFELMIKQGELIEHEKVHQFYYGTPRRPIERFLKEGKSVILDLDVKGAVHIKKIFKEAVLVFIKPPSIEVLKQRLMERNRESESEIKLRFERIELEMEAAQQFDYQVVNDDLEIAVRDVMAIIESHLSN